MSQVNNLVVITPKQPDRIYYADEFIREHQECFSGLSVNGSIAEDIKFATNLGGFDSRYTAGGPCAILAEGWEALKIHGHLVDHRKFPDRETLVIVIGPEWRIRKLEKLKLQAAGLEQGGNQLIRNSRKKKSKHERRG